MEKEKRCKECGNLLVEKATKQSAAQRNKPYYYRAYYWCAHCHKLYHDSKFKVTNTPLFEEKESIERSWTPARNAKQRAAGGSQDDRKQKKQNDVILGNDSDSRISYDIEIWTDGACVYNGTPRAKAAWAFVSGKTERAGLVAGRQTNNIAEALAIYHGLAWAVEKGYKKIKLSTDSQISLFNMKKPLAKIVKNQEIFGDIFGLIEKNKLEIDFVKVLGHSGDPNNERADRLANGLVSSRVTR
ncbi:MAG: RNase H family protein [Patescibacteria group bacterium]